MAFDCGDATVLEDDANPIIRLISAGRNPDSRSHPRRPATAADTESKADPRRPIPIRPNIRGALRGRAGVVSIRLPERHRDHLFGEPYVDMAAFNFSLVLSRELTEGGLVILDSAVRA